MNLCGGKKNQNKIFVCRKYFILKQIIYMKLENITIDIDVLNDMYIKYSEKIEYGLAYFFKTDKNKLKILSLIDGITDDYKTLLTCISNTHIDENIVKKSNEIITKVKDLYSKKIEMNKDIYNYVS